MLKKARSFREKIKRGTLGRTSSSRLDALRAQHPLPSAAAIRPESRELPEPPPNVIKVRNEKKKVQQALNFINFAVEKRNMIMLPGSATIALETTMELISVITTMLSGQETSAQMSYLLKEVYDSLSQLIQWADQVMLMKSGDDVDIPKAKLVIQGIETSVGELTEYACDRVALLKPSLPPQDYNTMTLPSKPRGRRRSSIDRIKRNSLPDVPTSPRETTILRETSLGAFDNPLVLDKVEPAQEEVTAAEDEPPPKPHLPQNFDLRRHLSQMDQNGEPPALPQKQIKYLELSALDGVAPFPASIAQVEDLSPVQPITLHLTPESVRNGYNNNIEEKHLWKQKSSFGDRQDMHKLSQRIDNCRTSTPPASLPPPLPGKQRERIGSDYDNIDHDYSEVQTSEPSADAMAASNSRADDVMMRGVSGRSLAGLQPVNEWHKQQMTGQFFTNTVPNLSGSSKRSTISSSISRTTMTSSGSAQPLNPPPLPPKKKHVQSYMHMFGGEPTISEFNSSANLQSRQFYLRMQEQHQWELFHTQSIMSNSMVSEENTPTTESFPEKSFSIQNVHPTNSHASELATPVPDNSQVFLTEDVPDGNNFMPDDLNPLSIVDVRDQLIRDDTVPLTTKSSKTVQNLRGGSVDALIVYATHVGKHELNSASILSLVDLTDDSDFMYQEAFLTTYRTFVKPSELIEKLLYRYNRFSQAIDLSKKRLSRNAFSLLVRVVDELTSNELTENINMVLLQLVCALIQDGELTLAKILRKKVLEKCDPNQRPVEDIQIVAPKSPTLAITLLDLKSHEVAEQMTLIENDFYQRLELPELLIWSKEQDEERCPNLVTFTEHFNKMSWWCRYMLLRQDDPSVREKYYLKFVNILKHLRKHNNFNSLLALLSALDSAPVRRLDWPKQATEVIQEFCVLIDSSSSFKAYRHALAEAEPPCIPYIGMILMDMTFIRIGNSPKLPDGNINFQMRWHLFNVLECLRRFRKPAYPFKKDQKILQFLDNFNEYKANDDEMWERSKELKPTNTR